MSTLYISPIGANMAHALAFARRHPGWHTFARDRATREAVMRLERRGMVEVTEHFQFRAAVRQEVMS